jgi:CubicO group peptidase (beta-lactamase class C family)
MATTLRKGVVCRPAAGLPQNQLLQTLKEVVAFTPVLAPAQCNGGDAVRARRAPQAEIDTPWKQRLEGAEALSDDKRRMVRQHHAAGADPDFLRRRRDLPDQDVGRGNRDRGQIVMLGDPVADIAEPIGVACEIDTVAQGRRGRRAGRDESKVKDGKRRHRVSAQRPIPYRRAFEQREFGVPVTTSAAGASNRHMSPGSRRLAVSLLPALLVIAAATALGTSDVGRALYVAPHFVSHQLCSAAFIARVDPDEFYQEGIAPQIAPAGLLTSSKIDRERREVTATFGGLFVSKAAYHGPLGCQVIHAARSAPDVPERPARARSILPAIAPPEIVEPQDSLLRKALDRAFEELEGGPHRWTKAVVIVHDGQIIAERYAPGTGVDTPLLGWSMTKSVTNALIGILVRQDKLKIDAPAPIAAWPADDPRHAITIDHLLRMTSGLDIGQSLTADWTSAFDPSSQMNFDMPDMAGFAERARLKEPPGRTWKYANGNTMLLSRIIRDSVGGDAASVLRFAHRELFDKLGIQHVTLEFDNAGTPIGSSHMWASARDWARFGLLYLGDGVIGGERILPEGWADYSAQPTPGSESFGYGAGFWTNRGSGAAARARVRAGMPPDSFMARGSQGQSIVVIPSSKLVIVRLGMAWTPLGDIAALERLVADAVAAVQGERGS